MSNLTPIKTISGSLQYGTVKANNYNDLSNKPKINDVELSGNTSFEDLGLDDVYAKKSTTLSGYGITDAYTKTEVDAKESTLNTKIADASANVGKLSDLTTTAKTNIVAAVNELDKNVDALIGSVSKSETSMKATRAYEIGDYINVNGKLYKATKAIASGATLSTSTNVAEAVIGDELKANAKSIATAAEQIASTEEELNSVKADFLQNVIYDTASGSVATFSDGAHDLPCKSVVAQIVPVQSGSGDPSPDNVRPISGWDAVTVEQRGKNLVSAISQNLVRHNGNPIIIYGEDNTVTIKAERVAAYDACFYTMAITESMIGLTFTVSAKEYKQGYPRIAKFPHGNYSVTPTDATTTSVHAYTITQDDVGYDFAVRVYNGTGADLTFEQLQLELGSTATPYEPYTGSTYSVNLPQTVYGGQVDVVSGEGKVTYGMVDLGTLTWTYQSGSTRFFSTGLSNVIKAPSSNSATVDARCSAYKYASLDMVGTSSADKCCAISSSKNVYVKDTGYTDAESLATALSGVYFCYPLATPVDFTVTPQEVPTLYGSNTVYADSGDVSVEYPADTKLYINKVITDAVSALS